MLVKKHFSFERKRKPHSEMQIKVMLCWSKNNNNTFAMMFCKRVITFQPLSFWVTSWVSLQLQTFYECRRSILSGFAFLRRSSSISMTPLTPSSQPLVSVTMLSLELLSSSRNLGVCSRSEWLGMREVRIIGKHMMTEIKIALDIV